MMLLTVKEVAEELRITRRGVCKWASAGKIPGAFKIPNDNGVWRFHSRVVRRWLKERERSACPPINGAESGTTDFNSAELSTDERLDQIYGV